MYRNLTEAIGNTPLVKVHFDSPATIYAKLEYLNPGGSVKDRSAIYMIEQAEKQGRPDLRRIPRHDQGGGVPVTHADVAGAELDRAWPDHRR